MNRLLPLLLLAAVPAAAQTTAPVTLDVTPLVRAIPVAPDNSAALTALGTKLDTLHADMQAVLTQLKAAPAATTTTTTASAGTGVGVGATQAAIDAVAVKIGTGTKTALEIGAGTAYPTVSSALADCAAGCTINVRDGTYPLDRALIINPVVSPPGKGVTIAAINPGKVTFDGQNCVETSGAPNRCVAGKAVVYVQGSDFTLRGIRVINGGAAPSAANGKAGVWIGDVATASATLDNDWFDGNNNGVFTSPAGASVTITNSHFGMVSPNGASGDGKSHDIYIELPKLTISNTVFAGTSRANTIKMRGAAMTLTNNWIGKGMGRWIDQPGSTATNSSGNTYVSFSDQGAANNQNALGFYDEADTSNNATVAPIGGTFTSTGDTFYFHRFNEVIWINVASAVVQFSGAKAFGVPVAAGAAVGVTIQGPGTITGPNPFATLTPAAALPAAPSP